VVSGFTTALLNMHPGDYWRVTIPYQLGYGATASGSVPAYSTLIFEIKLVEFWSKKRGDRY
jgi:FKBP-type peptidyl-prolyl cis-trans isomerase FklB